MKVGSKQKPKALKKYNNMKGKTKKKIKKKNTASIQKVKVDKKDIVEIHERQQRLSRRNSPNIKTRTTATKQRWKGWRYHEEPSEVITYSIEELLEKQEKLTSENK